MSTLETESIGAVKSPPRVLEYTDYHRFVRDFYQFKKSLNPRFSYRLFASRAGIKSSNFLMLVMNNERRLSQIMARAVAKAMGLPKVEADYFVLLVRLEQCQSDEERLKLERERRAAVTEIVAHTLPKEKSEYLSVWYYPLIRELAFLPDFNLSGTWISQKLQGLVTEKQAEKAVSILLHLGLWKIDSKGRVSVNDIYVTTGPDDHKYEEVSVVDIHKGNLQAWGQILGSISSADRELGLLNIPINSQKIPELKKRIRLFQDEIIGWLQDESSADQIVQLGTYLVPVTTRTDSKAGSRKSGH